MDVWVQSADPEGFLRTENVQQTELNHSESGPVESNLLMEMSLWLHLNLLQSVSETLNSIPIIICPELLQKFYTETWSVCDLSECCPQRTSPRLFVCSRTAFIFMTLILLNVYFFLSWNLKFLMLKQRTGPALVSTGQNVDWIKSSETKRKNAQIKYVNDLKPESK